MKVALVIPRLGHAGRYTYCLRCGTLLKSTYLIRLHFAGMVEYPRYGCSGIPDGMPKPNPAPRTIKPDLWMQERRK